nr:retrovirus-related Pol polyprotein from transposon TNT 1-94 [Tanacetum cinerariifolium]
LKKYEELTDAEKLQDDYDVKAINIVLQVTVHRVLVNTKYLNTLLHKWSKFLTNVKLARNMHTMNYDQLYAYLIQHEAHANEVHLMHERLPFKMVGLPSNKFRGDKVRGLLTDDLDAFDSDCDEELCAKVVLMANLSSYDSNVISEVPISKSIQDNSIFDNGVQEMYYSKQPKFDPASYIEIISDRNIISYDQYLKELKSVAVQNTASVEQQNVVIMLILKEIPHLVAKCNAEII